MLRLLIGTGLLLMALGFGAAGWQYWKGQGPGDRAAQAAGGPDLPGLAQGTLVSLTGTPVPREEALAFLAQDRFVPARLVKVTATAPLADLLAEGETLPEHPYLQVLADIRAPRIAQSLCPVLTDRLAEACAVHAARVVEGSIDPVAGTARFTLTLAFRQRPEAEPLPDLATQVLGDLQIDLDLSTTTPPTAADAMVAALEAVAATCAAQSPAIACRLLALELDWQPGRTPAARAHIAWLAPMPEGMIPVPALDASAED